MSLNTAKCKVMNIGRQNQGADYTNRDQNGDKKKFITTNERDFGLQISKDLKPHDLFCKAASTANRVIGLLKNTFDSRDPKLWKRLNTTNVSPILEYAIQVWKTYDVAILEKVQRVATKISHLLKHLTYILT